MTQKKEKFLLMNKIFNSVTLSSLRKNISMVSQDIILFDDTVKANIAYANIKCF